MSRAEEKALEKYPIERIYNDIYMEEIDINARERIGYAEGYRQAEEDLGWHDAKVSSPPLEEEVIVLTDDIAEFKIAFGHIVVPEEAVDFSGWNIPGVRYWRYTNFGDIVK